jgi:hypothetical protein
MVFPAFPGFVMTAVGGGFCGVCKMRLVEARPEDVLNIVSAPR